MLLSNIRILAGLTIAVIVGVAIGVYSYAFVNKIEMSQAEAIFFGPLLTGIFLIASAYISNLLTREREQSKIDKEKQTKRDALIASLAGEFRNIVNSYINACEFFDKYIQIVVKAEEQIRPIFNSQIDIARQQASKQTRNNYQEVKYPKSPTTLGIWLPDVTIHLYETVISDISILDHDLIASVLSAYVNILENNTNKTTEYYLEVVVRNKETFKRTLFNQTLVLINLLEKLSNRSETTIPPDIIKRGELIQKWRDQNNA